MRALVFVCLALALVFPHAAFAQSPQPPDSPEVSQPSFESQTVTEPEQLPVPPKPVGERAAVDVKRELRVPIAVWAASVAADQTTTYLFSSRYPNVLHERNVLIRGLDQHPAALVAAGTAIDVATGWAAYRLLRGHPTLAKVVFYGAAAYRTYLAAYNIRMMQRAQAITSTTPGPAVR